MASLPFTICEEDYAKDGTLSLPSPYVCETAHPITNANDISPTIAC